MHSFLEISRLSRTSNSYNNVVIRSGKSNICHMRIARVKLRGLIDYIHVFNILKYKFMESAIGEFLSLMESI